MSYLIRTYSKTEHEITDEQEFRLRNMSAGDKIRQKDGSTIMVNNIAEIIKIKEDGLKLLNAPERIVFNKAQLINALTQMIKGYKKHFGDRILSPHSQAILTRMENKLTIAKKVKDNKVFNNPIFDFL